MTAKTEDVFQARGPIRLAETEGCTIWQFRNKTGDGTMAAYEVFPGAMVSFNDFHMARYDSGYVADRELLAIDHCREGRMEYQAGENAVAYTEAGDVKLDRGSSTRAFLNFRQAIIMDSPWSLIWRSSKILFLRRSEIFRSRRRISFPVGSWAVIRGCSTGRSGWSTFSGRCTRFRRKSAFLI